MKKIIKLTESDLYRIIKRVINEKLSDDKFEDFEYYFDKENYNSTDEKPIFIKRNTQEVYISKEDKLEKLSLLIPKKEDIGFDNQNKPNQYLMVANRLCRIFDKKATTLINVSYTEEALPIDIVFIDNDKIPKKGKIAKSSKTGTIIKITQIAQKM